MADYKDYAALDREEEERQRQALEGWAKGPTYGTKVCLFCGCIVATGYLGHPRRDMSEVHRKLCNKDLTASARHATIRTLTE